VLRQLHVEGFRIAIVTNESIDRFVKEEVRRAAVVKKPKRLDGFMKEVNVPCLGIIAFAKDGFRKPETSSWELIATIDGGAPEKRGSFFVGDACGRLKDHSDVDKEWAAKVGISFFDETAFFVGGKRMPKGPAPPTAPAAPMAGDDALLPSAAGGSTFAEESFADEPFAHESFADERFADDEPFAESPPPLPTADELAGCSVKELRAMLRERGGRDSGCVERSDLVERLLGSS
jgi:DNA 3'-phosphatase